MTSKRAGAMRSRQCCTKSGYADFDSLNREDEIAILDHIAEAELPAPLALILFPATAKFADATIKYLRHQLLAHFDAVLIFSDDCRSDTVAAVRDAVKDDPRITVCCVSQAQNDERLSQSRDVFLAEGGVLLREHAFYMFVVAAMEQSPCIVYADEDHLDAHGIRRRPQFKPCFSPELLRRTGYTGPCVFLHGVKFDVGSFLRRWQASPVARLTEALVAETKGARSSMYHSSCITMSGLAANRGSRR